MDSSVAKLIRQPPVGRPSSPRDKVRTLDEVAAACEQARRAGQTVVQAHGTFDLLHLGHVRHLEAARKLGDVLIVTVTADRFVNKGPGGRCSMPNCAPRCWPRSNMSIGSPSTTQPTR